MIGQYLKQLPTPRLRTALLALATMSVAGGVYAAQAAAPTIAAAIAARQASYKDVGGAFKAINDELKSSQPDVAKIRPLAKTIQDRALGQLKYFPAGSGPEAGLKTRAKAEIWTNQADFKKLHGDLVAAAGAMQDAAVRGDVAAITAARARLGGTCKACHDTYRTAE